MQLFAVIALESLGQLVRAGGIFESAANPLHALDGILHPHSLQQVGDALQVAVAAALHAAVLDDAAIHVDLHIIGANAFRLILNRLHSSVIGGAALKPLYSTIIRAERSLR